MLTDLLCSDNYVNFNIKLAHTIGLHSAIYINELLNISQKATKKKKLTNDFMTVDRDYIQQRTTLIPEEQITIDQKLTKIGVIEISLDSPDMIKLNIDTLTNIAIDDDAKLLGKVAKLTTVKSVTTPGAKLSMRQRNIMALKDNIVCSNDELLQAYKDWIDGVYANPKGFLSAKAIAIFQKGVDDFAKGDLDLALKIVEIATVNGYRNVDWAINVFQKDYAKDFYRTYTPVEPNNKPVKVQVGSEVF